MTFEAFEGSPLSENVLAAEKALQWDFPGCAVAIPYSVFEDASFQNEEYLKDKLVTYYFKFLFEDYN